MTPKPICLIILDGWGHREETRHNAIAKAKTPYFDYLWSHYPHTLLEASGEAVGLPANTIGSSEIGHMTMGAGRVFETELVRINKAIEKNELITNLALQKLFTHVSKHNSFLHVLGLVSPAGVHSHQKHLFAFLQACKHAGIEKVIIHAFTDGRDSPPKENSKYLEELEAVLENLGIGFIATATGRYFSMDRDKNWHRTKTAEAAIFEGKGAIRHNKKASETLRELYAEGAMDEYLEPIIFLDQSGKSYPIQKNDGVFFFNFRTDRPRQLSQKIVERTKELNLFFVTMTEYHPDIEAVVAFPPQKPLTTLADIISLADLKQSHIAETEKYGHVTFFFNGGKQTPHKGEQHFLIDSRKDVATHDQAPEMKAKEITDKAIERIEAGDDFILINFANADMVGHTANKPAIIASIESIDKELRRIIDAVLAKNGACIVTADHGNAEVNFDVATGELHTAHTLNPVPFILVSDLDATQYTLHAKYGSLADIAPTILALMCLSKPHGMTGKSLV